MTEKYIRAAILGTVFGTGVFVGIAIDKTFLNGTSPESTKTPGGLWVSPKAGETTGSPVHFDARAYPTRRNVDPNVEKVNFTVSWEGRPGPWIVACRVDKPIEIDHYRCDWDPSKSQEKVPQGKLNISFDVYDSKGNANLAPNGTRTITHQPSQSREFIPGPNLDIILRDFAKDTINPDNSIFRSLGDGVKAVPMKGWIGEYKTLDGKVEAYIPSETGKELNLLFDMPGVIWGRGSPFAEDFSEEEMLSFAQSLLKNKLEWNKNERELTNGKVVTDSISYHIEDEKSKKDFKIYRDGRVSLKVVKL